MAVKQWRRASVLIGNELQGMSSKNSLGKGKDHIYDILLSVRRGRKGERYLLSEVGGMLLLFILYPFILGEFFLPWVPISVLIYMFLD